MKNMKFEQTQKIERMLEIGMTHKEICRAMRVGQTVVLAVVAKRNQQIITDIHCPDFREI